MDKDTLLERIQTSRRQLERYIFYFEKDDQGTFRATNRPKFGAEEMVQPGLAGDWSVHDLLTHLIDREERLLPWLEAAREGKTPDAPLPYLEPTIETSRHSPPASLRAHSIDDLLANFRRSHQYLCDILVTVPERTLFAHEYFPGNDESTLAQATAAATYEPYEWTKVRLRRWRKTHPGHYLNKEKILARIRTERRQLDQTLELLDEAQILQPGVVGDWSVKDILAHLIDWERRFIGWYRASQRGVVPKTPAPDLSWSQLDILNQRIYETNRDRPLADVLATYHHSYRETITAIEAIPEEEIFDTGRYEWVGADNNLVNIILANTANHYRWAKTHIREWMKEQELC